MAFAGLVCKSYVRKPVRKGNVDMKRAKLKATVLTTKGRRKIDLPLSLKKQALTQPSVAPLDVAEHLQNFDEMGIPVNGPDEFISSDLPERTRRKITAGSHWIAIKNQLVNAAMAQACLPPHTVCGVCNSSLAVSRCEYCGPRQYVFLP